jgi:uncharacterized protein YcfL
MKKAILLSLVSSFIFIGCSEKEPQAIFKDKLVCVEQQKLDKKEPVQIRVHNDDLQVALAHKASIDMGFRFYENQVDRNNKFCEEIENMEKVK